MLEQKVNEPTLKNEKKRKNVNEKDVKTKKEYSEEEKKRYYELAEKSENLKDIPFDLHPEIAEYFITEKGWGMGVAYNFEKYHGLDHDKFAKLLIEHGAGENVARYLGKFQGLDHQEIADLFIKKGEGHSVGYRVENFHGLNNDTAKIIYKSGFGYSLSYSLGNFQGLDYTTAELLLGGNYHEKVVRNLEKFQGISHQLLANHIVEYMSGYYLSVLLENLDKFQNLTIKGFRKISEVESFLMELESVIPEAVQKLTIEKLLAIMTHSGKERQGILKSARETPFLAEAFLENKYADKLLFKYQELDQTSKENITFLYGTKSEKGNVDPGTPEFRRLVQEKLKSYKNNKSIIDAIREKGVNTENWLNYTQQEIFNLGEEDKTSFTERIHLPVIRLTEIQTKYIGSFKDSLKLYREKLFNLSVQEEAEPLQEDLEKMHQEQEKTQILLAVEQSKPEIEQDKEVLQKLDKKLKGVSKGIESLQKRIENPKSVPAWDRLMGEVASLERVMESVRLSSEALTNYDKEVKELVDNPSTENQKKLLELKMNATLLEKKFREDLNLLDSRVSLFEKKESSLLENFLGEDDKNAIINSFHEVILEDRDHMYSDISTLQQLIGGGEKNANSLNGTLMGVRVWNRNPDEDLYLGNYTDCCIRIDSQHMGEESTIADYLTDLGVQVVCVYDEKKKIPVIAAWSWVGINKETGEVGLVIDNIEANTEYSIPYQSQLSKKLKRYFDELAESIGVKKVVQGQDNNDLAIFKMKGDYVKLGGYNRDGGYFLEAEWSDEE